MGVVKVDSPPVLDNGTGTPYLAIFNGAGGVIVNPRDNMPIGELVTSFRYKYKEDGVDEGEFTVRTDNPDLPSLETLQYNKSIILQWGYIYPHQAPFIGPPRSVIITEHNISWSYDGVTIKIGFAARDILTKNIPADWRQQEAEWDTYFQVMKDIVDKGKVVGWKILDTNQKTVVSNDVILELQGDAPVGEEYQHIANGMLRNPYKSNPEVDKERKEANVDHIYQTIQAASVAYPDARKIVKVYDSEDPEGKAKLEEYLESDDGDFIVVKGKIMTKKNRSLIFKGAAKNIWNQAEELSDNLPGGPYMMSARDNTITIKNRNINRPVSKVYTFMGGNGELLTFKVDNKFTVNYTDLVEDADIDPETGEEKVYLQQNVSDPNVGQWVILNTSKMYEHAQDKTRVSSGPALQDVYDFSTYDSGSQTMDNTPVFDSVADAVDYFQNNPGFTEAEYNELIAKIKETVDKTMKSEEAWMLTDWDYFDNYRIKRKVKIRTVYDLAQFYAVPGAKFERNITFAAKGGVEGYVKDFMNGYAARNNLQVIEVGSDRAIHNPETDSQIQYYPIDKYLENPSAYSTTMTPTVVTVEEQEIEVPLHATQIRAARPAGMKSASIGNDLQKSLDVACKAHATVVGDPSLEDCMNIYIQNVSQKYSGVWYATEVEHIFSISGGYTCNIEFLQRDIVMSTSVIKASINLPKKANEDQLSAQESLRKGDYTAPNDLYNEIQRRTKETLADNIGDLYGEQDQNNSKQGNFYAENAVPAEEDVNYAYQDGASINFLDEGSKAGLIQNINENL